MNLVGATYKAMKKANTYVSKNAEASSNKKEMTNTLLTVVFDSNKSDEEVKAGIRQLIVNKITDGTKLSDKDRIDIVECAWLCYRLNRDAGRSRVVSWILGVAVMIDCLGCFLFGKKNNLKDITNAIYKTAKRPIIYAVGVFLGKVVLMFLPSLLTLLAFVFGFFAIKNTSVGISDIFEIWLKTIFGNFKPIKEFLDKNGIAAFQSIISFGLFKAGVLLSQMFGLLYAIYVAMFHSIRSRTTNVSRKEINQPTIFGLESQNISTVKSKKKLKEDSSISSNTIKLGAGVVCITLLYKVIKYVYNKSSNNLSEGAALISVIPSLLGAIPSIINLGYQIVFKFISIVLIPFISSVVRVFWGVSHIIIQFLKGALGSVKDMIKKLCSENTEEELIQKKEHIAKKTLKLASSKVFKGELKDIPNVINKIDTYTLGSASK